MRNLLTWCMSAVLAAVAATASALPITFSIDQVYSNADGTVQFVRIFDRGSNDCDAGESAWTGLTLVSTAPGRSPLTYTFGTDLPHCRTSGRNMLIATEGFVALGLLAPDYVIPNGFVPIPAGTLSFADVGFVAYSALPSDGVHAINASGAVVQNVATNLAGAQASVVPGPSNYQDLWWAGQAESGWGISLSQHGSRLFGALYIYDSQGKPLWIVMPGGAWNAGFTAFTGALYTPTGSWFGAYDASRVVAGDPVGNATITFTSLSTATLSYTINGVSGQKSILRQPFGAVDSTPVTNYGDLWWGGSSQNGWGLAISQQYRTLFSAWYTYDSGGKATWYVVPGGAWTSTNTFTGKAYRTTGPAWLGVAFNASVVVPVEVGTMTFTFTDRDNATMSYTIEGVTQAKQIARQPF